MSSSSNSHRSTSPNGHPGSGAPEGLSDISGPKAPMMVAWDHAQDYGPRVVWPPENTDDNEEFDPEGAMPVVLKSISEFRIINEPVFQEMGNFCECFG